MARIMAIDPGTTESAWVYYNSESKLPMSFGKQPNIELFTELKNRSIDKLAIEMVASMGMPVGQTTFETVVWIGRFMQYWIDDSHSEKNVRMLYRKKDMCMHLCGTARAKDPNIRQAIMDRYGSSRENALGTKKKPGPLYGFADDIWSAMAIAIVCAEKPVEMVALNILGEESI